MSDLLLKLSDNPMIIVVGVLVLSCVLAIPCLFYAKYVKEKEKKIARENKGNAFLYLYGNKITIDGKSILEYRCTQQDKSGANVILLPGKHTVSAMFGATRDVDRFNPGRLIEVELDLQPDYWYTIGGYEYSADQRYNYYKGQVPEHILDLQVDNKFLICYKESDLNGNPVR